MLLPSAREKPFVLGRHAIHYRSVVVHSSTAKPGRTHAPCNPFIPAKAGKWNNPTFELLPAIRKETHRTTAILPALLPEGEDTT